MPLLSRVVLLHVSMCDGLRFHQSSRISSHPGADFRELHSDYNDVASYRNVTYNWLTEGEPFT